MISKEELNEDQLKSFNQLTLEAGWSEKEALVVIQKWCIERGHTGLKCTGTFKLSDEGKKAAIDLLPELRTVVPCSN